MTVSLTSKPPMSGNRRRASAQHRRQWWSGNHLVDLYNLTLPPTAYTGPAYLVESGARLEKTSRDPRAPAPLDT